jgi:hypothetical protein
MNLLASQQYNLRERGERKGEEVNSSIQNQSKLYTPN